MVKKKGLLGELNSSLVAKEANDRLKDIPLSDLIEDPDNKNIYGDYDIDGLAQSMRENGFKGAVTAYPYEGKYRIQSGHRTVAAAREISMEKIPVLIVETPKTEIERRKNLVLANLHGREYTPMRIARQAQYLWDTYEQENFEQQGTRKKTRGVSTAKKVAADLEVSEKQVFRYRNLLKLTEDLQELVESGAVSWAAMAEAAKLTNEEMACLNDIITNHISKSGKESVTHNWLVAQIKSLADKMSDETEKKDESRETKGEEILTDGKGGKKRGRKVDSERTIKKSFDLLNIAFGENSNYNKNSAVLKSKLIEMREYIDNQIKELDKL